MPFVRVARDKRGYEHIYLFEVSNRRPSKPRLLYWFRTPPGVRVGREPFDEAVKRALEALNPGVAFDWKKLASATLAPPDVETWRARRLAEREAKRARRGDEERALGGDEPEADDETVGEGRASEAPAGQMLAENLPSEATAAVGPDEAAAAVGGAPDLAQKPRAGAAVAGPVGRHRRRRGGRRRSTDSPNVSGAAHSPNLSGAPQVDSPGSSISMSDTPISATARVGADPAEEK